MNLSLPKVKLSNGLMLREIELSDYLDYYLIGKSNNVCKYLNWGPFIYPNEALYVIKEIFYNRPLDNLPIGYAIIKDNHMIGIIDFHTIHKNENSTEIGFILHEDYHNQGIMSKALKKMIEIGFNYFNFNKLIVSSINENKACIKVIEKCGFKYEFQKIEEIKNENRLLYYYSLYRYEFMV